MSEGTVDFGNGFPLCSGCSHKICKDNMGTCKNCGGSTTSGSFKLCNRCGHKTKTCQRCEKPLG